MLSFSTSLMYMTIKLQPNQYPNLDLELMVTPTFLATKVALFHRGERLSPISGNTTKYEIIDDEHQYSIALALNPIEPTIVINEEKMPLMSSLKWHDYLIGGLPFFLMILGGLIGGAIGGISFFANMNYLRYHEGNKKYIYVACITLAAAVCYMAVVTIVNTFLH